ncbi:MAG: holdfast anchoring protein HfaA [Rhizomicrobium sp.]|nr:holdfast anchoring protein HfaA [Rhizomicrobium sp.]
MPIPTRHTILAAGLCAAALCSAAGAADFSNAASYNSAYGMTAGQENQAVNPSLRDANGNLSVVNGQFTSSSFSRQTGVQTMGTISSSSLSSLGTTSGAGTTYGSATAIGNSLNVVTVGNNNTVIVNSTQTNTGNITAKTSLNGSSQ